MLFTPPAHSLKSAGTASFRSLPYQITHICIHLPGTVHPPLGQWGTLTHVVTRQQGRRNAALSALLIARGRTGFSVRVRLSALRKNSFLFYRVLYCRGMLPNNTEEQQREHIVTVSIRHASESRGRERSGASCREVQVAQAVLLSKGELCEALVPRSRRALLLLRTGSSAFTNTPPALAWPDGGADRCHTYPHTHALPPRALEASPSILRVPTEPASNFTCVLRYPRPCNFRSCLRCPRSSFRQSGGGARSLSATPALQTLVVSEPAPAGGQGKVSLAFHRSRHVTRRFFPRPPWATRMI